MFAVLPLLLVVFSQRANCTKKMKLMVNYTDDELALHSQYSVQQNCPIMKIQKAGQNKKTGILESG